LKPLPETFASTRDALHRVAEEVVAPARKPHNEIALVVTPGGFGTPEFEHGGRRLRVRVDGAELVVEADDSETRSEITCIEAAGAVVGDELLPDGVPEDTSDLDVEPEAAERLAEFYAFAAEALDSFKGTLDDGSETNLWPEHFDVAFDAGDEEGGKRITYGASPGDENHPEPYLYVLPWTSPDAGELWNASGFRGAELGYAELLAADDPLGTAVDFLRSRREALEAA
jgi:hypothetical protein